MAKIEKALGIENLYAPGSSQMVNHLIQALRAESLYSNGVEYLVVDGEVKIVDEFTGRIMEGRRWSEGLHQAVEAKENVKIEAENVTVATVTIQNYFRLYEKLAGMTGTALTEANEFHEIYGLEVVPIPTNVPVTRLDQNDLIYKTEDEKFRAVVNDIAERHAEGQPVLVGTISVEVSERVSGLLERKGIPHNVLNAKTGQEGQEAQIIKDAGAKGAVTIATNMAGRGVDIKLGDGVIDKGGLYVIGTERHESRRIDNQLRGRSGRQGDPGETRFFLSAEDQLVRLFAGDRIYTILDKLGPGEDQPIEHKMLTKRIEGAQKRVEEMHFDMRKQVLKYDDVLNKQREVIYAERRGVLEGDDLSEEILEWIDEVVEDVVMAHTESNFPEEWDLDGPLHRPQPDLPDLVRRRGPRAAPGDRPRGADHALHRRRAPRLRAQGEGALGDRGPRRRHHAAARALLPAAGHRRPLARAPRRHGLPARGHPPALDGAEGSARRVPRRGPRDVRGHDARRARGSRLDALPRRGDRAGRRSRAPRGRAADLRRRRRAPDLRRCRLVDVDLHACGRGRLVQLDDVELGQRIRSHRPQRPLPLRLGAEVQALPRARCVDAHADRAGNRFRGVEGPPGVGP